jgi:hypothetical protein
MASISMASLAPPGEHLIFVVADIVVKCDPSAVITLFRMSRLGFGRNIQCVKSRRVFLSLPTQLMELINLIRVSRVGRSAGRVPEFRDKDAPVGSSKSGSGVSGTVAGATTGARVQTH